MITPELINFIKSELAKGKLQEQIKSELVTGGWNSADLDEAFSAIFKIPAQSSMPVGGQTVVKTKSHSKIILIFIILLLIGGLAFGVWYFYRPQIEKILGINSSIVVPMTEIPTLLSSGKDYICNADYEKKFNYSGDSESSVDLSMSSKNLYYISSGKMKLESTNSMSGITSVSHIIADGDIVYTWGDTTESKGVKTKEDGNFNMDNYYNYNSQVPAEDRLPDLNCKVSVIDHAVFIPPADISFDFLQAPVENNVNNSASADITPSSSPESTDTEKHIYENSEYGFYFDSPNVTISLSSNSANTAFIFKPNDSSSLLTIIKTYKGEQSQTEKIVKSYLEGSTYTGKISINGIMLDRYTYSGKSSEYYSVFNKGTHYLISVDDPQNIKYFGFIN